MNTSLSPNAQAILLLTAPLIAGRENSSSDSLTPSEYKRLAQFLREKQRQPADLLSPDALELISECQPPIASDRFKRLLARGFLLSQAIERWQTRAIWVVSREDGEYPKRLKTRLGDDTPPILYGCGDAALLETGGLAVVGSRHVDNALLEYTKSIGQLAAKARRTTISGGARGIDQAAVLGALDAGGKVAEVLADSLERAALNRKYRNSLMDGQLVLISPYDPSAGFNVGNAMQRNKLIYALADAAMVVSSDYEKGGTWYGAVEQLEKLRLVPVYVRSVGETGEGLMALRHKGALPWPNPETPAALAEVLAAEVVPKKGESGQKEISFSIRDEHRPSHDKASNLAPSDIPKAPHSMEQTLIPADERFAKVRELLERMTTPKTEAEVAADLQVNKSQAKAWLQRLVNEGVLEKLSRPARYRSTSSQPLLFDRED